MFNGWYIHNKVLWPDCDPHDRINGESLRKEDFKQNGQTAFLARWIEDFDCGYETEWYHVIKDEPFDITKLKAKRRYEITKGNKFFDVRKIEPSEYSEQIYDVHIKSLTAYPEKYRGEINKNQFIDGVKKWSGKSHIVIYGAFFKENGKMCGYAMINPHDKWCAFSSLKTDPEYEKYAINAAVVYKIMLDLEKLLSGGGYYFSDGQRSIYHETAFQDYLQKYFGFRKAYCKLNIKYNPKYKLLFKLCYMVRFILYKFDRISFIYKINSILRMEEIVRKDKRNRSCGKEI